MRNLKKLTIGKHTVIISDTDDKRTITIGSRDYIFKRFHHGFKITDEKALEERKNGSRDISAEQQILCYVPEFSQSEFQLYCGLPTKHKIKIPMAIDAPFSLTTSREEIETEGSKWNDIIRREMYFALLEVIDSLKIDERAKVFRFLKFVPRFQGNNRVYVNDTFENKYLNGYDLLSVLRTKEIIPTFDNDVFAVPIQHTAYRFPEAAVYIISKLSLSEYEGINSASVIDKGTSDCDSVLNALACEEADCSIVLPIIFGYAERFIRDEVFRNALYDYLVDVPGEYVEKIKDLRIIPVYGSGFDSTEYISWKEDSIFVKPNSSRSGDNYWVLNEKILSKSKCEAIFSININEMSVEWEHSRYNAKLKEMKPELAKFYKYNDPDAGLALIKNKKQINTPARAEIYVLCDYMDKILKPDITPAEAEDILSHFTPEHVAAKATELGGHLMFKTVQASGHTKNPEQGLRAWRLLKEKEDTLTQTLSNELAAMGSDAEKAKRIADTMGKDKSRTKETYRVAADIITRKALVKPEAQNVRLYMSLSDKVSVESLVDTTAAFLEKNHKLGKTGEDIQKSFQSVISDNYVDMVLTAIKKKVFDKSANLALAVTGKNYTNNLAMMGKTGIGKKGAAKPEAPKPSKDGTPIIHKKATKATTITGKNNKTGANTKSEEPKVIPKK